jgi:hypothetical protein
LHFLFERFVSIARDFTLLLVKNSGVEELKWDPSVQASNIGVEVKDGIVTLAGHVDTYTEK